MARKPLGEYSTGSWPSLEAEDAAVEGFVGADLVHGVLGDEQIGRRAPWSTCEGYSTAGTPATSRIAKPSGTWGRSARAGARQASQAAAIRGAGQTRRRAEDGMREFPIFGQERGRRVARAGQGNAGDEGSLGRTDNSEIVKRRWMSGNMPSSSDPMLWMAACRLEKSRA